MNQPYQTDSLRNGVDRTNSYPAVTREPTVSIPRFLCASLSAILAIGCGKKVETDVISIPDPQVTVITLEGDQRSVPASDLYDPKTGQPAGRSVMVIDRQSNRSVFVDLDQLSDQSQMDSRYILMTDPAGGGDPPAALQH